jgi:hypothetical protein
MAHVRVGHPKPHWQTPIPLPHLQMSFDAYITRLTQTRGPDRGRSEASVPCMVGWLIDTLFDLWSHGRLSPGDDARSVTPGHGLVAPNNMTVNRRGQENWDDAYSNRVVHVRLGLGRRQHRGSEGVAARVQRSFPHTIAPEAESREGRGMTMDPAVDVYAWAASMAWAMAQVLCKRPLHSLSSAALQPAGVLPALLTVGWGVVLPSTPPTPTPPPPLPR